MITEIRDEIYTQLQTVTGLSSSNIYYLQARQNTDLPYCVFQLVNSPFSRDTVTDFETNYIQFALYGTDLNGLEAIEKAITTVFDNNSFSGLTDYTVRGVIRESRFANLMSFRIWQIIINYRLEFEHV